MFRGLVEIRQWRRRERFEVAIVLEGDADLGPHLQPRIKRGRKAEVQFDADVRGEAIVQIRPDMRRFKIRVHSGNGERIGRRLANAVDFSNSDTTLRTD